MENDADHNQVLALTRREWNAMQLELEAFTKALVAHTHSEQDFEKWENVFGVPNTWNMLRSCVPELDVRQDDVLSDPVSPLARMQNILLRLGLLRPPKPRSSLGEVELRDYERWQDHGYFLLPKCMHRPWHRLISEEFNVTTEYVDTTVTNTRASDLKDHHLRAYQDRIVQKLCSLWIWGRGDVIRESPAFQRFIHAYEEHQDSMSCVEGDHVAGKTVYAVKGHPEEA